MAKRDSDKITNRHFIVHVSRMPCRSCNSTVLKAQIKATAFLLHSRTPSCALKNVTPSSNDHVLLEQFKSAGCGSEYVRPCHDLWCMYPERSGKQARPHMS